MASASGHADASSWFLPEHLHCALNQIQKIIVAVVEGAGDAAVVRSHLFLSEGKRLRPILVLLAAEFGPERPQDLFRLAAAVEILHTATLYHDDVTDEAATRRFRASANALWGNRAATFAGASLVGRAVEILASRQEINLEVSRALVRLWEGQIREAERISNLDVPAAAIIDGADRKTGTLYRLAVRTGAIAAAAPVDHVEALTAYATNFGIAFQLTDDVLDLTRTFASLGKPPGTDLREGVYTLPVFYALERDGARGKALRAILTDRNATEPQLEEAVRLIRESGALADTASITRSYIARALDAVDALPECEAAERLRTLASSIEGQIFRC